MELTTSEIATGIVFVAVVLLSFRHSKDRKELLRSLLGVVKAFAAWKGWTAVLSYLIFMAAVVALAYVGQHGDGRVAAAGCARRGSH